MLNKSLYINLDSDLNDFDFIYKYELDIDKDGEYTLAIYTDIENLYQTDISDYNEIRKCIKNTDTRLYTDTFDRYKENINVFINMSDNEYKEYFENIEYIHFRAELKDIYKYLLNNPELKTKKIVLSGYYNYNDDYPELDMFKDYNVFLETNGNNEYISLNDYYKTKNRLDEIVNEVKRFNFSPIEQVMYVYDFVRKREYTKENVDEKYTESRDVSKILFGDKIVCLGYSNLFNILLEKLGFKTKNYFLDNIINKRGHARSIVYIKDDKYEIKGVYAFDPTWDSKKKDSIDYLYTYKYFAKTINEINCYRKETYKSGTFPKYDEDMFYDFIYVMENKGIFSVDIDVVDTINEISHFVDGKGIINKLWLMNNIDIPSFLKQEFNIEEVKEKLLDYDNLLNNKIDAETMLKILFNVRKKEYYNNPNEYPFDINNLYCIVKNSGWFFDSSEIKLLRAIFGDTNFESSPSSLKNDTIKFIKENDIDRKIEQIKLTKTLMLVRDKLSE